MQLAPCLEDEWSLLFPSDFQMSQQEAMLLLLIFAFLGTPAVLTQGKSSLKKPLSLSSDHLMSLNPGDIGTTPSLCHRLNIVTGLSFLAPPHG